MTVVDPSNCPGNCNEATAKGVCTPNGCECDVGFTGKDCGQATCCPAPIIIGVSVVAGFVILCCCTWWFYKYLPRCPGLEERCKKLRSSFGSSRKNKTRTTPVADVKSVEADEAEKGGGASGTTPGAANPKKMLRSQTTPIQEISPAPAPSSPKKVISRANTMPDAETVEIAQQANADFARNFLMNQLAHDSHTTVAGGVTANLEGLRNTAKVPKDDTKDKRGRGD